MLLSRALTLSSALQILVLVAVTSEKRARLDSWFLLASSEIECGSNEVLMTGKEGRVGLASFEEEVEKEGSEAAGWSWLNPPLQLRAGLISVLESLPSMMWGVELLTFLSYITTYSWYL